MTPEQQADHDRIVQARKMLDDALKAHVHVESDSGCIVCGQVWGHSCGHSPDGRCHYFTIEGSDRVVRMNDGAEVTLRKARPKKYQTDDDCFFCGMPDERK